MDRKTGHIFSSPIKTQVAISATLLIIVLLTCLGIDVFARRDQFSFEDRRQEVWKRTNSQYQYLLGFSDFEERLLLDELPKADYSHGGVYFIGSSNLKVSLMSWELPPDLQGLIHNYATSNATHRQEFHFIRYLVEHEGLLEAGGEKTAIVLGLFYHSATDPKNQHLYDRDFFTELFNRYGMYTYSTEKGIIPVQMSRLERYLRIEKIRCSNYLQRLLNRIEVLLHNIILAPLGKENKTENLRLKPTLAPDIEEYHAHWHKAMGPDWEASMAIQMQELNRLIEYLQERKVHVSAFLLPLASWHHDLPYPEAYWKQVNAVCDARSVPLIDLTRLLADDEFNDSNHANYNGQQKLHAAMMDIALPLLHKMGRIP